MRKQKVVHLSIILLLLISSCQTKAMLCYFQVVDNHDIPVDSAKVRIIRNNILLEEYYSPLTPEDISKINAGDMIEPIFSDSLGEVYFAFSDSYFINPNEIKLIIFKPGYDTARAETKSGVSLDNIIILNKIE